MIKITCYRTIHENLPKAFCMLAEKCYHNGIVIFVHTNSMEYTLELDKVLWTYSKKEFIPHGTIHDTYPEKQPILLGHEFKNLNNSTSMIIINAEEKQILSLLSATEDFDFGKCKRLLFLYDQNSIISDQILKKIITKSPLGDVDFESYVQESNKNWQIQSQA